MKRKHRIALTVALAVLLLASIACSCGGGPKPLTARGGGCSDVYCYSLYGEGIGTSRDAAYNQAVGQLNAATQRNNRCGGSGLRIVKEQTLSGSYFVKVEMHSTVKCGTTTADIEAANRATDERIFYLIVWMIVLMGAWFIKGIIGAAKSYPMMPADQIGYGFFMVFVVLIAAAILAILTIWVADLFGLEFIHQFARMAITWRNAAIR